MKTTLYIIDGESVARIKQTRSDVATLTSLGPKVDFAVSAGSNGEFSEWQIAHLLERLQSNQKAQR